MIEENEKVGKVWRTLAIVFIILFIVETLLFAISYKLGVKIIELENECIEVCQDYPLYYLDTDIYACSCYNEDEKLVYQEILE